MSILSSTIEFAKNRPERSVKFVICDKFVEYIEADFFVSHVHKEYKPTPKDPDKYNLYNYRVTKRKIRRLIDCNPHLNKFLTLTFRENLTDISKTNLLFHAFVIRCREKYPDFQYICVPEFQKRGAVHYHLLCSLPFFKPIEFTKNIWRHGSIDIKRIDRVQRISSYMTKYLSKAEFLSGGRLMGKKKFFTSARITKHQPIGLFNPIEYRNVEALNFFSYNHHLLEPTREPFFLDLKFGSFVYKYYKFRDNITTL